jgi:hypothetical protein
MGAIDTVALIVKVHRKTLVKMGELCGLACRNQQNARHRADGVIDRRSKIDRRDRVRSIRFSRRID